MSLTWFRPDNPRGVSLEEYAEAVKPFGIYSDGPTTARSIYFYDDETGDLIKEIGTVFWWADDSMMCRHRRDATELDQVVLLASASRFLRDGTRNKMWRRFTGKSDARKGQTGWRSEICVTVDERSEPGRLIAQQRQSMLLTVFDEDRLDLRTAR